MRGGTGERACYLGALLEWTVPGKGVIESSLGGA